MSKFKESLNEWNTIHGPEIPLIGAGIAATAAGLGSFALLMHADAAPTPESAGFAFVATVGGAAFTRWRLDKGRE